MGAAGCCGFGVPPSDDDQHARVSSFGRANRSRRRASNVAAFSHLSLLVPWLEDRNKMRAELSVSERDQYQAQLAEIADLRVVILAQPVELQDKAVLDMCDQHEASLHGSLALLDRDQQRRVVAVEHLRSSLAKHRSRPTSSLVVDLLLPCLSWCVDVLADAIVQHEYPALVQRAQEWVREAYPMLDEALQGGPLLQHQRVVETCLRIGCYNLVDRLLRRFGGTCEYTARPSRGGAQLSDRSWLWVMATCNYIHVTDFSPIVALISAHGLDPTLMPAEPNPQSALQIARAIEKKMREEALAAAPAPAMPDSEAVPRLLAALAPTVAASSAPAASSSSSSAVVLAALSSSAAVSSSPPHFENCLLRYTTYAALPTAQEEVARCTQTRVQFLIALLRAWRAHSAAVQTILLEAAPHQLIPDLVGIVAEYLDLDMDGEEQ